MHQCLIYIGRKPLSMADGQSSAQLQYRNQLVDCNIGFRSLIESDDPNALVLSILCNFEGESPDDVLRFILTRLQELTGQDEKMRREYLQMLGILTDNRDLSVNIQEAYDKLHIDIEKLPSYPGQTH